jgi:phosphodiesterase/alkaline phosphatase D-like protein
LPDAVVVWTRYTPTSKEDVIELEFRMAAVSPELDFEAHLDPEANDALKRAKVTVAMESDFIAKIDVSGLDAGTNYVFAFSGKYC